MVTTVPTIRVALMRGLHGSGKTDAAERIKAAYGHGMCTVMSVDDYFMFAGKYKFVFHKLNEFHAKVFAKYIHQLTILSLEYDNLSGDAGVVIDQCNLTPKAIDPLWNGFKCISGIYRNIPMTFTIVDPDTEWQYDVEECARRSSKGIAIGSILKQADEAANYADEIFERYNTGKTTGTIPVSSYVDSIRKTVSARSAIH